MAEKAQRYEDNVKGKWYVDKECIDCDLCNDMAPDNFRSSEDEDHSIVYKQPGTEEEQQAAQEALEACPVDAIGNDNEE